MKLIKKFLRVTTYKTYKNKYMVNKPFTISLNKSTIDAFIILM